MVSRLAIAAELEAQARGLDSQVATLARQARRLREAAALLTMTPEPSCPSFRSSSDGSETMDDTESSSSPERASAPDRNGPGCGSRGNRKKNDDSH